MQFTLHLLLPLFISLSLAVPVPPGVSSAEPTSSSIEGRDRELTIRDEETVNTVFGLVSAQSSDAAGEVIAAVFRSMEASPTTSTIAFAYPVPSTQTATWSPTPFLSGTSTPFATSHPNESDETPGHTRKSTIAAYLVGSVCVFLVCVFIYRIWTRSGVNGCYSRKQPSVEQVGEEWTVGEKPAVLDEAKRKDRQVDARVINIRSGFPFSRFSDYSSEGSCSSTSDLSCEADNLPSQTAAITRPMSHTAPLLCPADFFIFQSASSILRVTRQQHGRTQSAPERCLSNY